MASGNLPESSNATVLRWDRWLLGVLLIALVVIKVGYVRGYPIDSDEPQHMHVVWGWTQGLVQYRDYFDNHTPLFHMLMAPLAGWLGERADILYPMRLAMLPFYFASLAVLFGLAGALSSLKSELERRRAAFWTVLVVAIWPVFILTSTEFRTDDLWMFAWFSVMAVLFSGELTLKRWFLVGVLLGGAFSASMKTSLLMAALLAGAVPVLAWRLFREGRGFLRGSGGGIAVCLLGAGIVPAILLAIFASLHSLGELYYCVIEHNMIGGNSPRHHQDFLIRIVEISAVGVLLYWSAPNHALATRRTMLFLSGAIFIAMLWSYWPLVTAQDYLPVVPLIIVAVFPAILEQLERIPFLRFNSYAGFVLRGAFVIVVGVNLLKRDNPYKMDHMERFSTGLAHLLKLAHPDDYVMDAKGETIFRHRPYYYVLEGVTRRRMRAKAMKDTLKEDCEQKNTCVVINNRIQRRHREWLRAGYLEVAEKIWVAGVEVANVEPNVPRSFTLMRSSKYQIISSEGKVVKAMIDGVPVEHPVELAAGEHELVYEEGGTVAVIWAQSVEAGLTPYTTRDLVVTLVKDKM